MRCSAANNTRVSMATIRPVPEKQGGTTYSLHKQKDSKSATVCLNNNRSTDAATTHCSKWTAVTWHDPPLKCSPPIVPAHRLNHVASERFVCVIVSQGRVWSGPFTEINLSQWNRNDLHRGFPVRAQYPGICHLVDTFYRVTDNTKAFADPESCKPWGMTGLHSQLRGLWTSRYAGAATPAKISNMKKKKKMTDEANNTSSFCICFVVWPVSGETSTSLKRKLNPCLFKNK